MPGPWIARKVTYGLISIWVQCRYKYLVKYREMINVNSENEMRKWGVKTTLGF